MKMIICIVQDQDSGALMDDLRDANFRMTKLASTGGFLKSGNTTLLLGVEDEEVDQVVKIIDNNCKTRDLTTSLMTSSVPGDSYVPFPVDVKVGGATIFIVDVERHIKI